MSQVVGALRFVLAGFSAVFCVAALSGVATNPVPVWTMTVVVALTIFAYGVALLFRRGRSAN